MTPYCVVWTDSKLVQVMASHQAITWTNVNIALSLKPLQSISMKSYSNFSFKKCIWKCQNFGYFIQASMCSGKYNADFHDEVIKWKHFPRYWPFVRGIHRSSVNSPHKGQWRGAVMFSLICAWINGWVNNREAGVLRRHRAHSDVIVM